jgi:hypothetical protein
MRWQAVVKQTLWAALGLALILAIGWAGYTMVSRIWSAFAELKPEVAVAIVTAATTIFAAVLTIVLGRYFERQRELEAHFREEKLKLYERFLEEFFRLFHDQPEGTDALVTFLKEWQRLVVLRASSRVIAAYFDWKNHLATQVPDAKSVFLMDEFFRALRADVGQSSRGLSKGAFANLILKHAPLFLSVAKRDPNIKLDALAKLEKELYPDEYSNSASEQARDG